MTRRVETVVHLVRLDPAFPEMLLFVQPDSRGVDGPVGALVAHVGRGLPVVGDHVPLFSQLILKLLRNKRIHEIRKMDTG